MLEVLVLLEILAFWMLIAALRLKHQSLGGKQAPGIIALECIHA